MRRVQYARIRDKMKTNDLIFFVGEGLISSLIRTRQFFMWPPWGFNPSHVGLVYEEYEPRLEGADRRVRLIESTNLDGLAGVSLTYLSDRLKTYPGRLCWASAPHVSRKKQAISRNFMRTQLDKKYDYRGALRAGSVLLKGDPDDEELFCSELVTLVWQYNGFVPTTLNSEEITPKHVARWPNVGTIIEIVP